MSDEKKNNIFAFMENVGTLNKKAIVKNIDQVQNDDHMNQILNKIRKNIFHSNTTKPEIPVQKQLSSSSNSDVIINIPQQGDQDPSLWNSNIEDEIAQIAECCRGEADQSKSVGETYLKYSKYLQVSLIILGSTSVYISASQIPTEIKESINVVLGASTTIVSSIYTMFSFSKKGAIYKDVGQGLDNLSRILRCEILKPIVSRQSVNELILFAQMTRDKLLKKLDS